MNQQHGAALGRARRPFDEMDRRRAGAATTRSPTMESARR